MVSPFSGTMRSPVSFFGLWLAVLNPPQTSWIGGANMQLNKVLEGYWLVKSQAFSEATTVPVDNWHL